MQKSGRQTNLKYGQRIKDLANVASSLNCFGLLTIRSIIQRVERAENKKQKALMISEKVEWQFQQDDGTMVPFDTDTNLSLEEAYEKKQTNVKININNEPYSADVMGRKAFSTSRHKVVELCRRDTKGQSFCLHNHFLSYIFERLQDCAQK